MVGGPRLLKYKLAKALFSLRPALGLPSISTAGRGNPAGSCLHSQLQPEKPLAWAGQGAEPLCPGGAAGHGVL